MEVSSKLLSQEIHLQIASKCSCTSVHIVGQILSTNVQRCTTMCNIYRSHLFSSLFLAPSQVQLDLLAALKLLQEHPNAIKELTTSLEQKKESENGLMKEMQKRPSDKEQAMSEGVVTKENCT